MCELITLVRTENHSNVIYVFMCLYIYIKCMFTTYIYIHIYIHIYILSICKYMYLSIYIYIHILWIHDMCAKAKLGRACEVQQPQGTSRYGDGCDEPQLRCLRSYVHLLCLTSFRGWKPEFQSLLEKGVWRKNIVVRCLPVDIAVWPGLQNGIAIKITWNAVLPKKVCSCWKSSSWPEGNHFHKFEDVGVLITYTYTYSTCR